ncbi:MAG TPA: iron transporter FeoB [Clostridia bacterium]|nr:iron transporter FeoB [Clostridia bacterium]
MTETAGTNTAGGVTCRPRIVAFAGNPNTGKSTLFNAFTGLRQHTGNWPGKTVTVTRGRFRFRGVNYIAVDLPGTYSLLPNSPEERLAKDFIFSDLYDVVVVVTDATCLERNLALALQILEVTDKVVVCVNLIDEARSKGLRVNTEALSRMLGVPTVATSARDGEGLPALMDAIESVITGRTATRPLKLKYTSEIEGQLRRIAGWLGPTGLVDGKLRGVSVQLLCGECDVLDVLRSSNRIVECLGKLDEGRRIRRECSVNAVSR